MEEIQEKKKDKKAKPVKRSKTKQIKLEDVDQLIAAEQETQVDSIAGKEDRVQIKYEL